MTKQEQTESSHERIWCDPGRMGGKRCIRGTRVSVAVIVGSLADMSIDELLKEYPQLCREDIEAAISYVAAHGRSDK